MEDAELAQIRAARMNELRAKGAASSSDAKQKSDQQRQQDIADARQSMLNQILHPEAADRLGRIRLVNEARATQIEDRLMTLAQTGQLRQKVTEAELKQLLNAVSEAQEQEKIVVTRKGWDLDDDLDF
ncbi:DNA-binding TFAR19-related protein [Ceratocystis lukuohia]|uniref:Programmed cell death protein 5 n=3 Tax=Ceratocystis TaxID=5157 RepID=A0A0F8B597_CERFI|nr:putative protein C23C4.09c [Ceratocystis platani]PHH51110.1 DNA-binding protein MK1619 [Ceratocystis fimbriata CBS 114723]